VILPVCIGYPGRVLAVDGDGATVSQEGRARRASTLLLPEIAPGDWVIVAAGTIVRRLEPAEAAAISLELDRAIEHTTSIDRTTAQDGGRP
jgi:hydrogenase assembly chaperone HypC/HupF